MTEQDDTTGPATSEVVGRFGERDPFMAAVKDLRAAGFGHAELSVLDTHESIGAAGTPGEAWQEVLAGLAGEVNYVGPIAAAGLIGVATGPVGAAISATVAAGFTGAAVAELLSAIKATPHTEDFARALESGALLLWVHAGDADRQAKARDILTRHGAADVHLHTRPGQI